MEGIVNASGISNLKWIGEVRNKFVVESSFLYAKVSFTHKCVRQTTETVI